jgi:hypothetical protein
VYAYITLETVALDTPNNLQFLSQMLQLNTHQRSVRFQNPISLPFSHSFTRTNSAQPLIHWHEHYRV